MRKETPRKENTRSGARTEGKEIGESRTAGNQFGGVRIAGKGNDGATNAGNKSDENRISSSRRSA